jgi:WD40 repeat protein
MLGPTGLMLGLLILSLGTGLAAEWLLAPGHVHIDGMLIQPGGENRDNVTSLAWTPSDDLLVGTGVGRLYTYASDGEVSISNRHRMIHSVAPGNANGHYTIELETDMDQRPISAPDNTVEHTGMWRTDLSDASASIPAIDGLFAVGAPRADGQRPVLLGRFHPLEAKAQGAQLARPSIIMTQRLMGPGGISDISGPVQNDFGTDARAIATTPDGRTAIVGTGDGNVYTVNLTWSGVVDVPDAYRDQQDDYDAPIVAVAAGGPPTQPVLASASADGRVLVHRPDATEALSLVTALHDYVEAALPAADWTLIGQSRETLSSLVGISGDGDTLAVANGSEVVFVNSGNMNDMSSSLHVTLPEGNYDARSMVKSLFASGPAGFTFRPFSFRPPPPRLLNSDMTGTFVVVSNNAEDGVELYNAVAGRTIKLVLPSTQAAAAFSPSGDVLAVISEDFSISLYDTSSGHMLTRSDPPGINARPVDMAFSPDGRRLVVALSSGLYQLYSTRTLRPIFRELETEPKFEADISHDGSRLVRKISDESFEVVDLFTGHTLMQMHYGSDIAEVMISGDGSTVAVVDYAGIVSVFREGGKARPSDPQYSALLDTVRAGPPARDGLKLSADGSRLLLRTNDGRVFVAGTSERRRYTRPDGSDTGFYAFRELQLHARAVVADISPDGSFVLVSDTTNHLDLHDLSAAPDAQPIRLLEYEGVVLHLAIAPGGREIAAASLDGRLSLIDVARARFAAALPLARLASYADPPLMLRRELDEPPGGFPDPGRPGDGDIVVIGTHTRLEEAQDETMRAHAVGLETEIFSRAGVFRTAVAIPSGQADSILRRIRSLAPGWEGAYIRFKDSWCPSPDLVNATYWACTDSVTRNPAAAN